VRFRVLCPNLDERRRRPLMGAGARIPGKVYEGPLDLVWMQNAVWVTGRRPCTA
jgi:hypothetical protein